MKATIFLVLSLLICLGNANLNGSMPLVENQNEWNLLEEVLGTLLQKEQQLSSQIEQLNDDESDDGEWVIKVKGGLENAIRVANETKITLKRQVRGFDDYFVFEREYPVGTRSKRSIGEFKRHISENPQIIWAEHQIQQIRTKRVVKFNDPLWKDQWEMKRETKSNSGSMRIPESWNIGFTGRGIIVNILDDGVDHSHPDLKQNYEPRASYDLNGNDVDPMPTMNEDNKHGTRCAGEISMIANNSVCGVGVAFNSKFAGVRMLDGSITDRLEAEALTTGLNLVDIYSASWGPADDGKSVEGPGKIATDGIYKGIRDGRNGKGVIYVWASGNGGNVGDNCNCDGYASSIFTFSVSAATEDGDVPWYSEPCASTIVATYSSGSSNEPMIATTDTQGRCTREHTGTSAAAPLAAGIVALGLESNPSLTWRDVQHLAVWTSNPAPLMKADGDWHKNGVGLLVSNRFGFGLMDALNFVTTAKTWKNVPEFKACMIDLPNFTKRSITSGFDTTITFSADACRGMSNQVNYLEHIQLKADISHSRRGNLEIYLISPMGTKTQLLSKRPKDDAKNGFRDWPFMSLHTWGENPQGVWEVHVVDVGSPNAQSTGTINKLSLVLFGTKEAPAHYSQRRSYPDVDFGMLKYQKRAPMANMTAFIQSRTETGPVIAFKRSAESEAVVEELTRNPRFDQILLREPRRLNSLVAELINSRNRREQL